MKPEFLNACDMVLGALANGVCEGLILAALVALFLRFSTRTNAATRHAAWFVTLLLVVAIIPAQGLRSLRQPSTPQGGAGFSGNSDVTRAPALTLETTQPSAPVDGAAPAAPLSRSLERDSAVDRALFTNEELASGPSAPHGGALPSLEADSSASQDAAAHSPQADVLTFTPRALEPTTAPAARFHRGRLFHPLAWTIVPSTAFLRITTMAFLVLWLALAAFKLGLLCWRLHRLVKIKQGAFPPSLELEALVARLCRELGVKRSVQLKVSLTGRSPLLLGFWRPVILLGVEEARPTELAEQILRHELAHVRRRDDWVNLVQQLVQSALFFHPAVWWICRQLSLEREIACDDCVLDHDRRPRVYALLLAELAARAKDRPPLLAPGVLASNSQLKQRIHMILKKRRNASPHLATTRLSLTSLAAVLLSALTLYCAPRLVLAQNPNTPDPRHSGAALPESATVQETTDSPVATADPANPLTTADPAEPEPRPTTRPVEPRDEVLPAPPRPAVPPRPTAANNAPEARPPRAARPPRPPGPAEGDRYSLESRLDRLERMVETLVAQRQPMGPDNSPFGQPRDPFMEPRMRQGQAQAQEERARADAQRAEADMQRATDDMQRARERMNSSGPEGRDAQVAFQRAAERQLEALRRAREDMNRQMENLNRQIERLEQERSRMERQRTEREGDQPRRDNKQEDQPEQKAPPPRP